ncbi:hypothetical protein [Streptomyces sp. NPDC059761]|uniref:hypothetical protein n=1 Tax=Streptomyces sp. NPDC059761 TaxID=3346937 RepID=UPI00364EE51E
MTPAAASAIPDHIQTAMEGAAKAGWGVVRTPGNVKLNPPQGERGKRITLSHTLGREEVESRLAKAGIHLVPALPAEEASEPRIGSKQAVKVDCPECGKPYGRGQGLWRHRSAAHGVGNTTTIPGNISATGLPSDVADAARILMERVSANLTSSRAQGAAEASGAVADLQAEIQRLQEENQSLSAKVRTLETRLDRPRDTAKDDRIKTLAAENRKLTRFRDRVEAEVMNQNQAPIATVVNIIKLGGHGFALNK